MIVECALHLQCQMVPRFAVGLSALNGKRIRTLCSSKGPAPVRAELDRLHAAGVL